MNAQEMFEQLGYEVCHFATGRYVQARRKKKENPMSVHDYGREVWFDSDNKNYKIFGYVDCELHLAIHQQMKELGWIDD